MTQVKICGVKRVEHALVAAEAGADFLGFMFFPGSRRYVEPSAARDIIAAVKERSSVRTVGVFVNADPAEMNRIAAACGLDYVQLSGDETDAVVGALDVPAIQAIHVGRETPRELLEQRMAEAAAEILLLDTAQVGVYGGTGKTFDWNLVPAVDRPVLLAGGLHPDNVHEAVGRLRPWGVDVSNGVEINGEKDSDRIRAFVRSAKRSVLPGNDSV